MTRRAERSKLLQFKYLTKTEVITLDHKNHDIQIQVIDIKSVELYTILVSINHLVVGKFRARGIKQFKVVKESCEIVITTEKGKIYLLFKN